VILARLIAGSTNLIFKVEAQVVDMWTTPHCPPSCPHIHNLYDDYGLSPRLCRPNQVEEGGHSGNIIF